MLLEEFVIFSRNIDLFDFLDSGLGDTEFWPFWLGWATGHSSEPVYCLSDG
ncbi:MAG: hypothetical protein NTU74_14745 [Deltaproteobacteria bacterium]|nr:hypothetical protein [Deltaproteobacteria bacterium]